MPGAMDFGIADDGQRTGREQAAQIAIAAFADIAEPVLASARVLLRHEPNPGREVPPRPENPRIRDAGNQSGRQRRTDTGDIVEPPARLTGSVPSPDHTIELQNLCLQHLQLGTESGHTRTCNLGQSPVTCISDDAEQLLDTMASDRRDNPELRKMSAESIDHRGLLADEQVTGTMKRQATLLLRRLGRDEPHVGPGDRLADRLGVSRSFLCRFTYGFT